MRSTLALLTCIGAGTVGGVFFAFSTFVMTALGKLPVNQGVAAMQRINVVVLNPMFLGLFFGTAILSAVQCLAAFVPWRTAQSPLLAVAGLLYLVGSFLVTIVFNVPRNERLAQMDADSAEAREYWPVYLREWSMWNHARTAASLASAVCSAAALLS